MEMEVELTVNDLSAKFRSKAELYNVLVKEGNIYLLRSKTPQKSI